MTSGGDSLSVILSELLDGPRGECFLLNRGDKGLLASLDDLPAAAASKMPAGGGASIAAHVDHVHYGFELLNRYVNGEDKVWEQADWTQSWTRGAVDEAEWAARRARFRETLEYSRKVLAMAQDGYQLTGAFGFVAHLAYHFGAIRQIDRSVRGPSAEQVAR